jgi:hypothetical protein
MDDGTTIVTVNSLIVSLYILTYLFYFPLIFISLFSVYTDSDIICGFFFFIVLPKFGLLLIDFESLSIGIWPFSFRDFAYGLPFI